MTETTEQTDARRAAVLAKIVALRAKTAAAGATEAEAMAAAEKAAELMDLYGVTEADLANMRKAGHKWSREFSAMDNGTHDHKVLFCVGRIAMLTQTRAVFTNRRVYGSSRWTRVAEYFGEAPDVELACWLHAVIRDALDNQYAIWRKSQGRVGSGAKQAFQLGMCRRINERVDNLVRDRLRQQAQAGTGRALVVVKDQLVKAAFEAAYGKLGAGPRRSQRIGNGTAYGAGRVAGDKVGLGRPLGGQGSPRARITG